MTTAEPWQVEDTKHFGTCFYQILAKPPNCAIKLWASSGSSEGRRDWSWNAGENQNRCRFQKEPSKHCGSFPL